MRNRPRRQRDARVDGTVADEMIGAAELLRRPRGDLIGARTTHHILHRIRLSQLSDNGQPVKVHGMAVAAGMPYSDGVGWRAFCRGPGEASHSGLDEHGR